MADHEVCTREEWRALPHLNAILDPEPKGRDEDDGFQVWLRRHDEYGV